MNLSNFFPTKAEDKILSLKYKKTIDEQIVDKLTSFIQSSCKKSTKIIIAVDGTINSLVLAVLFNKAMGEKVMVMIFDFEEAKTTALVNICKSANLNTYVLNRNLAYQKELTQYHLRQKDIRNFYIRFTNYHLSIQADMMKADLVDIIDKSDRLTDQRPNCFYGSFVPFYSLYKTEVYDLAKLLGINQPPNNTDYWKKLDPILFLLTEKQLSPEQISQEYNVDLHWLKKLKSHIDKQPLKTSINQFII